MGKPKLLILAKAYPPNTGGVETYSEEVALAYKSFGYQVFVVTQREAPASECIEGGIRVINVGPGRQIFVFIRMIRIVSSLVKHHRFQFTHATTWRVGLVVALLRHPRPLFVTVHGREIAQTGRLLLPLMHFVFRNVSRSVVISSCSLGICSKIEPLLQSKGVVSWNGLSYRSIAQTRSRLDQKKDSNKTVKILSVCRLVRRKNVEGTLRALHILKNRGAENWVFEIAGSGPQLEFLKSLAAELGLAEQVTFLGHRPRHEIPDLYSGTDIFVHPQTHSHDPADFESFCLTIVDAMSFGLPVIAGTAGAPAEYLTHGELGFVVDGTDHSALADELIELITDQDLRTRIGRAAKAWALNTLSWPNHVERLLKAADIAPPIGPQQIESYTPGSQKTT